MIRTRQLFLVNIYILCEVGFPLTQQNRRHPPAFESRISVDLGELGAERLHG